MGAAPPHPVEISGPSRHNEAKTNVALLPLLVPFGLIASEDTPEARAALGRSGFRVERVDGSGKLAAP